MLQIFWKPHKMKGEIWEYTKFSYLYFRWESLLVENGLKIIVIVREGDCTMTFSVGKGTICFRTSFPLLLLWFCQCSSFCPCFFSDFVKVKKHRHKNIYVPGPLTYNFCYKILQFSTKRKRTNLATQNQFLHFKLDAFLAPFWRLVTVKTLKTLKNAELLDEVLFDSTA